MSKAYFKLKLITKEECSTVLMQWHYLKDISKGFKSGVNYGLFRKNQLCGVCIFTSFPVPELVKGMYGLKRDDQAGFYELSRLCLDPSVQGAEHNIASWFVSRAVRLLKQQQYVRAILSYADADFHSGTVYKACNFKYYGLTAPKKDFWLLQPDGTYTKHTRGKMSGLPGEWRPRSDKHRFVMRVDTSLDIKWEETK